MTAAYATEGSNPGRAGTFPGRTATLTLEPRLGQERERKDAERVCRQLNIGFHEVSFQREYRP